MKRFLSVLLTLCMLTSCVSFALPVLDAAEDADFTGYLSAEVSSYAKPGINTLTGTFDPYTFDGTTAGDYYTLGGAALAGDSNKYMEYSGSTSHFALKKATPVIEKDRQVKVTFKAQADTAVAKSVFFVRNTMNNFSPELGRIYTTITTNWATYTKDIIGSSQAVTNNSSIFTDNTQDIKQLVFISQSNNSTNKMRIDDVSIVPYYKVTYNANGGTGAPADAWWLPATSGGKYTVSATVPTKEGFTFAGWSLDGVTAVKEVTPANEDIVLVALWKSDAVYAKPGINVLTGAFEPYTFDGTTAGDYYTLGGAALAGDSNKYMEYSGKTSHFALKKTTPVIDKDRKVKVSFKVQADEAATKSIFLVRNTMNNFSPELGRIYTTIPTAWTTFTVDIMGSSQAVTNNSSIFTDNTQDIKQLVFISQSNNSTNKMRIDDVSIVPYYKVTYNANGGTGAPEDAWWLPATSDEKFIPSSTKPSKSGMLFAGWSLDGETAVTEVTPANEDIALTALWIADIKYGKPGINVWTDTEEPYTFDNATINDLNKAGTVTIETEGANSYVKLASSLAHFTLKGAMAQITPDRKVKVSFNFNTASSRTIALIKNVMNNTSLTWGQKAFSPASANTWNNTYTQDILVSAVNSDNLEKLVIMGINGDLDKNPINIDNVSVVPYYKVTYNANGGVTAPEDEWWLPATVDGKYTVSPEKSMRAGYKFVGWSIDGVNAVTEVTPANEDIKLVALWEANPNQQSLEYDFTSDVPGVADGTISIIAPSASYTTATIYFADANGTLDGYTAFGNVDLTQGIGSYTITGNRAFAAGATALNVVFTGTGVSTVTKTYTIPVAHRMSGKPLYTYYVISDTHLGGSAEYIDYFYGQWQNPTGNMRTHALGNAEKKADVFTSGADFVVINGDLINQGSYITSDGTDVGEERYWNVLDRYVDERLNIYGVPVFLTNGNHEFYQNDRMNATGAFNPDRLVSAINDQVDYIEDNYSDKIEIIRDTSNPDAVYYAANMYGTKYIFMSTPELSEDRMTGSYTVSDKQLAFIEAQLAEANGNTVFVITHMPIKGIENKDAVNALLAEYPNAIVFNSHTHVDLSVDAHRTVVGDMTTSFTTCDTGSTISTSNPYSTGQYVEVYLDKVVIKARKFTSGKGEFFGHALYLIDTPDENAFDQAKPGTVPGQEMRFDEVNETVTASIRVKGMVNALQRKDAVEYGMLVARKSVLEDMAEKAANGEDVESELTFNFKNATGKALYLYGESYKKDGENVILDKTSDIDDDGNYSFAAILKGIDNTNADRVNEVFVTRPYIKYKDGDEEFVFYGATAENSLVTVAKSINTDKLSDEQKESIEAIIALEK